MKKVFIMLLTIGVSSLLVACGSLPTCHDELDNCNRDAAYTEERTVRTHTKRAAVEPAPVVMKATPAPAPKAVVPTPAPVKAPIVNAPIMQSAEPQFKHISK